MKNPNSILVVSGLAAALLVSSPSVVAQQSSSAGITTAVSASAVPRLVSYGAVVKASSGKTLTRITGVTFLLYKDPQGGTPVWMETQNVMPDKTGHYTVQLGTTRNEGLPAEMFMTGEARWLALQIAGESEQARVLLVAVPYALKAADAETVGGLPPSAFVLAASPMGTNTTVATKLGDSPAGGSASSVPPLVSPVTTSGGSANTIPLFTTATNIQNSGITQTGSGTTAKIGINTTTPAVTLDVKGAETVRGTFTLAATGTATATGGKNSQPSNFTASVFNSASSTAVPQNFRWQVEPVANNTSTATGTLNLLFGQGSTTPVETGLKINHKGQITFVSGQTFPGTVTSVGLSAPSSDFTVTGSPVKSTGTLTLGWAVAPTSTNTANAIVRRNASGDFAAHNISATSINSDSTGSLYGYGLSGTGSYAGVSGYSITNGGMGVLGAVNGGGIGVHGIAGSAYEGSGVVGEGYGTASFGDFGADGVDGVSHSPYGSGVAGFNSDGGNGVYGYAPSGSYAVYSYGDAYVNGTLSKAGGSFKIDHPLDPANKYLYHSFVESPDMMNIYNGNVTTDVQGNAQIQLPDWFETLNHDFRYQLTVIGQFAQAIVANKIANHRFTIETDKPNVEVSWQVTGIRQDAWANAHRIPVEQAKPVGERGHYLHPELFGAPAESAIGATHYPIVQKSLKEKGAKVAAAGRP